ncbi:uncharacterized protein N7482_008104 [Penicillium canariense]|uniref:F-box domain-containing protein n=1 Tax=Penicillium canariense TaxID=189055 RepID=A0A9W9LI20_9EURO|nr:uncharacterized protein N7482_008104 [Penicillium canariense]KAJ5157004.1 hypothetical protein N7482_008104 [Penicillium canariense]
MTAPPCNSQGTCHDLAFLPQDLFWLVLDYLAPTDLVRCRRVSRAWNEAFSNPVHLVALFKRHFPWTQEVKDLQAGSPATGDAVRQVFDQVVARYDHLERGKPRSVQKFRLCDDFGGSREREWFQVQPWESHASHHSGTVDRQFGEAMWTHEDGLLVFPRAEHQCLVLMDLSSDRQFMVPFIIQGRVIRRVRLQKRLLVVEWAEPKAFHWLNDSDGVHRHFASSFDVTPKADDGGWNIVPRNEWKIMFLGHPLSERDRFFSAHSNTHYVIYIWQPNRSLYTADEDAPIESLFVWDISKQSSYRPSLDPTGTQTGHDVDQSPSIVARFGYRDLEFFSIRQRGFPCLQRLAVTGDGQAVEITENARIVGESDELWVRPLGVPQTVTTSIPLTGNGPHDRRPAGWTTPAYRSNCTLQQMPLFEWSHLPDSWYSIISQVADPGAGLFFWLHFEDLEGAEDQDTIYLTIETNKTRVTMEALDLSGRAKICGCDRYIVGESRNRELVIYRFDR